MRNLLSRLPEEPNLIEPKKLFKCQEHGDILVVGQYPEGETFGGTDKLSLDVWYSSYSQYFDLWKDIIGILNPGDENCLSSLPIGSNGYFI